MATEKKKIRCALGLHCMDARTRGRADARTRARPRSGAAI